MSEHNLCEGQCLCGKVKMVAKKASNKVGACHCGICRKWGGGPYLSVDCGTEVTITGDEYINVYDSSEWAERGFCKSCGTNLFYRLKQNQQHFIPVGFFGKYDVVFDHQVFIDEKPEYYSFSNNTKDMTGAELFALFSGN